MTVDLCAVDIHDPQWNGAEYVCADCGRWCPEGPSRRHPAALDPVEDGTDIAIRFLSGIAWIVAIAAVAAAAATATAWAIWHALTAGLGR